jgi:hypothetical protein
MRYRRKTNLPAFVLGYTATIRQLNKGRSETDCVLERILVQFFKFKTPREPGAHDLIRQDVDRASRVFIWGLGSRASF